MALARTVGKGLMEKCLTDTPQKREGSGGGPWVRGPFNHDGCIGDAVHTLACPVMGMMLIERVCTFVFS